MIAHLDGDFETVDYIKDRSILLYDNIQDEEYPPHWHNAVEIIMPLISSYNVTCGGREYTLYERDIMVIPAGKIHSIRAAPGRRFILLCDSRLIDGVPALLELRTVVSEPLIINEDSGGELRRELGGIMEEIYTLYSGFAALSEIYVYMKLIAFFTRIREHRLKEFKPEECEKYSDTIHMILNYIEKNYMRDITLEELASLAGYSSCHFSRIFKRYSGTTFISFLNNRRIIAAESILLEGNATVTQAAAEAGFSSLTTFNRVFREINGCTPSEFRKRYLRSHSKPGLPAVTG